MQLQIQLANPVPFDLEGVRLAEYKFLDARWHEWSTVRVASQHIAELIFDRVVGQWIRRAGRDAQSIAKNPPMATAGGANERSSVGRAGDS